MHSITVRSIILIGTIQWPVQCTVSNHNLSFDCTVWYERFGANTIVDLTLEVMYLDS